MLVMLPVLEGFRIAFHRLALGQIRSECDSKDQRSPTPQKPHSPGDVQRSLITIQSEIE
jgi:hypothetical protein